MMKMKNPPHPGEMIECMTQEMGLTVTQAASRLGVTRQSLSSLINGKRSLSPEMSLRIEAVFGGSAESWMRNQIAYTMVQARKSFAANIAGLHGSKRKPNPKITLAKTEDRQNKKALA